MPKTETGRQDEDGGTDGDGTGEIQKTTNGIGTNGVGKKTALFIKQEIIFIPKNVSQLF